MQIVNLVDGSRVPRDGEPRTKFLRLRLRSTGQFLARNSGWEAKIVLNS